MDSWTKILLDITQRSKKVNYTSNIGSPVSLDRAPNSMIIVPAQAVQVSDSLPVPEDGW